MSIIIIVVIFIIREIFIFPPIIPRLVFMPTSVERFMFVGISVVVVPIPRIVVAVVIMVVMVVGLLLISSFLE